MFKLGPLLRGGGGTGGGPFWGEKAVSERNILVLSYDLLTLLRGRAFSVNVRNGMEVSQVVVS
jgi:hypothetical protein